MSDDRICRWCNGIVPEKPRHRIYCSDRCRWRYRDSLDSRIEYRKRYSEKNREEINRKSKLHMRRVRATEEGKRKARESVRKWKQRNRDKVLLQRHKYNARNRKADAHVKEYSRYMRNFKGKHDAHVRVFYLWAKDQSAGWWMRHLRATGKELWRNPKLSDAIKYRIRYRLDATFRIKEINRQTWRKETLSERDDGTIRYRDLIEERKTCIYCGRKLSQKNMVLDHMDPICLGGENSMVNLVVCCRDCNGRKAGRPFSDWLDMVPGDRKDAVLRLYKRRKGKHPEQESLCFTFN